MPEGRCEYWDGELVEVMTESIKNNAIAILILLSLISIGVPFRLIRPGGTEVEVVGKPKNRFPDLTVLSEVHGVADLRYEEISLSTGKSF